MAAANARQRELAETFERKLRLAGYQTRVFDPAGQDDVVVCTRLDAEESVYGSTFGWSRPSYFTYSMLKPIYRTVKQPEGSKICTACETTGHSLEYYAKDGSYYYLTSEALAYLGRTGLTFFQPTPIKLRVEDAEMVDAG